MYKIGLALSIFRPGSSEKTNDNFLILQISRTTAYKNCAEIYYISISSIPTPGMMTLSMSLNKSSHLSGSSGASDGISSLRYPG